MVEEESEVGMIPAKSYWIIIAIIATFIIAAAVYSILKRLGS